MSCILRIGGQNFDVDLFAKTSSLVADSVWRKGERRFPNSKRILTVNDSSGVRITASDADMDEFAVQVENAIAFIRENETNLRALTALPGVEFAIFDFGLEIRPPGWASFDFPPELLSLAGGVGTSICVSVYPVSEETEDDA